MKSKRLYFNSTIFFIIICVFVLGIISISIKNYQTKMQEQLIKIYENNLYSNSDSLAKTISNRLNNAETAMHHLIDTYGTNTTDDFIRLITHFHDTSSMGKLSYYPKEELEKNIQNNEEGTLDSEILNSFSNLKAGNKVYTFYTGSDDSYLRIVMPVFSKNEFSGILVNGYNLEQYSSMISISNYSNQDFVMLLDKNTGFCTLDQNGNTNVNYFDYLNTVNFISGSLETLKNKLNTNAYGLIRFLDPANQIEYYMTYHNLGIANLVVCNLIPHSYIEVQISKINAFSNDLIFAIFLVVFIMIILIFIIQSITTIRIRNNQNHLQLEQDKFHTVMKFTQSAIWEYTIKKDLMEKPDSATGINLGIAKIPNFEQFVLSKNAVYEDDIPVFQKFCAEMKQGIPNISAELRALDMNGDYVWFSFVGNTIFDAKGIPISVLGQTINIHHEKQEMEILKNLSERDPLTKLYNRKTAQTLIDEVLEQSTEEDIHAFCMIDIDNFKSINDTYGHIFGDAVLTEISSKLKDFFEKEHIVSRYGGDEFIIFIQYAPSLDDIIKKVEFINEMLKEIYVGNHSKRQITTSVGIAIYPQAGKTQKILMKHADIALYYSKNAGKSCYHIYNEQMEQKGSIIEKNEDMIKEEELFKEKHIAWVNVDMDLVSQVVDFLLDARDLKSSFNMILSLLGSTYHLSRICIEEYSYEQQYATLTYDWINPEEKNPPILYQSRSIKEADATNYYKLTPTRVFYTDDIFSMEYPIPEDLIPVFKRTHLKCLYQCGFAENNVYHGCLQAIIQGEKEHKWTQKEISTLTMISKIIGGYLWKIHSEERAKNIEERDFLTNSYNFFKFISIADNIIKQSKGKRYLFVYTDIDMFKYINTTYGYNEGDNVLKQFAEIIQKNLKQKEIYCRATADKFIIMMEYLSKEDSMTRMDTLMKAWDHIKTSKGNSHRLTVKAGLYVTNYLDTATLAIDQADIAMRGIHESHKSVYVFFNESMKSTFVKQKEIEDVMDEALLNEEFLVYYQPKFNLSNDKICGAEALVRWKRPDIGLVSPDEFIPIFENNEFIVELDFYMLRKVCLQIQNLLTMGKNLFPISVNFSPVHLKDQDFVLKMTNIVDSYKVPRSYIEVELTESALFSDNNYLLATLNTLHELGFRLSMDDFGSGYSSLNLLRILPFDVVKLDKEFFHHGSTTSREQIIISNIIQMLKELHMQIVSEGVETKEQAQFLKDLKCDIVQGFLYEKPLPEHEFLKKYFDIE